MQKMRLVSLMVIAIVTLAVAAPGVAQVITPEEWEAYILEYQGELIEARETPALYAVYEGDEFVGVVPETREATDAGVIQRLRNWFQRTFTVKKLHDGGRILLGNASKIAEGVAEYICKPNAAYRPSSISFTAGFSAGPTVLTTVEYDVDDLC